MQGRVQATKYQLSVLTYNVWTGNDHIPENQLRLVDYITATKADIVCLQEVTRQFFDKIVCSDSLRTAYDFKAPEALYNDEIYDGELLMVKKELNAVLDRQVPLKQTQLGRYFASGVISINGIKIAISTAHLESYFFCKNATLVKSAQLENICKKANKTGADVLLFAGDCNLTGDNQLLSENATLDRLALEDCWKLNHKITEDSNDPGYRQNDITWDSGNNPHINVKNEYHRPDRVFMRFFQQDKKQLVKLESIERVVNDMSDHYGLTARISIG